MATTEQRPAISLLFSSLPAPPYITPSPGEHIVWHGASDAPPRRDAGNSCELAPRGRSGTYIVGRTYSAPRARQANLRHSRHLVQRDARCSALAPAARAVGALASGSVVLCSASSRQQHLCGKGLGLGLGLGFGLARRAASSTLWEARPVRPTSQDMPANWPRLAEAGGRPELDLALSGCVKAGGRFGQSLWAVGGSKASGRQLSTCSGTGSWRVRRQAEARRSGRRAARR